MRVGPVPTTSAPIGYCSLKGGWTSFESVRRVMSGWSKCSGSNRSREPMKADSLNPTGFRNCHPKRHLSVMTNCQKVKRQQHQRQH